MPCPGTSRTRFDQTHCKYWGIRERRNTAQVLVRMRELHAVGGPKDFEELAELGTQLDMLLRDGAPPPEEWENAFRADHDAVFRSVDEQREG